ncbi:hypothetical protein C2S51_007437 [Perilla frutescens var. frutescens]|nr:hypothetical protein C2S51_007437 [Perilla frutescens var. frutescens]
MALITGRIQALDPNVVKSSSFSHNREDHLPDLTKHSRSSSEPAPPENDVGLFLDHPYGGIDDNEQYFSKQNATNITQKEIAPLQALVASQGAKLPGKQLEYHLSSITPRDINLSIISSENTRAICSFVIAVLVFMSHINLPHKVIKSKSLIDYRPLYAVLLSDLFIVSATLALLSQGKESEKEVKLEADVNWDGAVKLLEWGLILHQTIRAVFIDCSLYLAIVICGLSFTL